MKRDNLFIYVGTAIFILLAIALGIIMYMMTKTDVNLENKTVIIESIKEIDNNKIKEVITEAGFEVKE